MDIIAEYAQAKGPTPHSGPIRDSFWAGYAGVAGVRKGIAGSVQRRAWLAGKARAKAEPGLNVPT